MKQTAAKRRLRRHKTTRRHNKRRHEGGVGSVGPGHAVAVALEAHHVQHAFFAMLSIASSQKINIISGLLTGAAAAGVTAATVATGGLALVGLGIVIFTAMAIRESLEKYKKLQHTVLALIQVLRKIQKTMMLCITMSIHYKIVINTHDLNVCLSNIYTSLDKLLTPEARETVKTYAQNYERERAKVENATDELIESTEEMTVPAQTAQTPQSQQTPNKVTAFLSKIGKGISTTFNQATFKSDEKDRELRELMSELTPFLVLLLSQSVLQFMVCQTSMITEGKTVELQTGNDAVKESCQYKDFQLSALLDSVMRITADLDREPANRDSHINALTREVDRIREIVKSNSNYDSFTGLKAKLDNLSMIDGSNDYDNLRAALTDLNTYDEQAFLKECNSQHQTESTTPLPPSVTQPEQLTPLSTPRGQSTPLNTPQGQLTSTPQGPSTPLNTLQRRSSAPHVQTPLTTSLLSEDGVDVEFQNNDDINTVSRQLFQTPPPPPPQPQRTKSAPGRVFDGRI